LCSTDAHQHMLGRQLIGTFHSPLTTGAKYHKRILHVRGKIYKLPTEHSQTYYEKLSVGQTAAAAGMTPGAILKVPSDCRLTALYKLAKSCFENRRQATADELQELCKALGECAGTHGSQLPLKFEVQCPMLLKPDLNCRVQSWSNQKTLLHAGCQCKPVSNGPLSKYEWFGLCSGRATRNVQGQTARGQVEGRSRGEPQTLILLPWIAIVMESVLKIVLLMVV
jgi:hypothetical protein